MVRTGAAVDIGPTTLESVCWKWANKASVFSREYFCMWEQLMRVTWDVLGCCGNWKQDFISDYGYGLIFTDKKFANHHRNVKAFSRKIIPLHSIKNRLYPCPVISRTYWACCLQWFNTPLVRCKTSYVTGERSILEWSWCLTDTVSSKGHKCLASL